ncbi:pyridoxal phosphate-dependent aminotransferase [Massilia sp. GCM10020059]|uniref:Aminotransferase class I/II-fold pyridoxal phosphate-dependent enzyme n=1 Tax=Massilia agrisoli TaxID=2892444 RepID=A0ABS8IV95_9BURK|nr:aminotransferase class I/II-fold pyridoxal phosphate-dependent enzyme [Massilia agrisoli]MCC6072562.1 aminotransferase class I/II-fold pyridoxal phosphate-dependent enzyme [Massilia agrisoli]
MRISKRIASASPLATTAMHGRVDQMKLNGEEVIDFSIAISHFAAPESVRRDVADMALRQVLPYTAVGGAHGLRARLGEKLLAENGIDASPAEIIVTNGAKQALYEAMYAMTDPGDTIIVFRPYWPAYLATSRLLGLEVVLVDLPDVLARDVLDALPPARLLILNNPHNPTGKVFTRDELDVLEDWLARTGCGAIVDESYEKLLFDRTHHSLSGSAHWRKLGIVTLFSASQSYAMMGWRCGFAVGPAEVVSAMETLQGPITAAPSALTQAACEAAFFSDEPGHLVADYRARRDLLMDMLSPVKWMKVRSPESGPYIWVDVSALGCDTVQFAERLLAEKKVAIMPGDALGMPGFIRMGFISDDIATLRKGIAAIVAFGKQMSESGG